MSNKEGEVKDQILFLSNKGAQHPLQVDRVLGKDIDPKIYLSLA